MYHFENLLTRINSIETVTKEFSTIFKASLSTRPRKNRYTFLKPGQIAKKIWMLHSGNIIAFGQDTNGDQTVNNIYSPGDVVTDLHSFYKREPVLFKYQAIGQVEVQELKRADFLKLRKYREIETFSDLIMLDEIKGKDAKSDMFRLPTRDMIIQFYEEYNISNLPDKYCASFLRLTLEKYIEIKVSLLKSEEITLSPGTKRHQYQTYSMRIASEVKSHILENYTDPDFGNLNKIAEAFNITERVVTLHFKKIHHTTVIRFLFQVRMEQALILLSKDKRPAKEVFIEVGYKNVSHFSKRFKIYYGYTTKTARAMDYL